MTLELTLEVALKTKEELAEKIKKGTVFIYPTDTVYGLGCDATSPHAVQCIRNIKGSKHPLSVIVPSLGWLKQNLVVQHEEFLKRLPGECTFIFKKKDPEAMPWLSKNGRLGIRIPMHPFTKIIQSSGRPFVTTSLNLAGKPVITELKDLTKKMVESVDVIIDDGVLDNPPSEIFDLSSRFVKKLR